jgi:hypothetical protein
MFEFLQVAKASFLVRLNCQLTCWFFALNTGNVFARSTSPKRFNRINRRANFNTAGGGRCSARQKISEMLCVARD